MRKIIYFLLILITSLNFSCSKEDDSSGQNVIEQKLIGKWYFADPEIYGYATNNSFTFNSNKEVTYSFWTGGSNNEFNSETGSFSVDGDILTMTFPDNVVLVFIQKVEFINDNKVEFLLAEGSGGEPYDGTYYRDTEDQQNVEIPQVERDALMALYNSTDGPNWTNNTNWGTASPVSTWYGIKVESFNGIYRVTWINVPSNNLTGTLPQELGNLTELTLLGFYNNQLSGELPISISNCTKLDTLALDYNNFHGNIPVVYKNLIAMESLYLSGNNLTGDVSSIYSFMPNLERLYLNENNFEGSLDLSANVQMRLLFLMDNNLSKINLKNGNSRGIEALMVENNPNLTCIFVDDRNNIPGDWRKDPSATYVETQEECDLL